MEKKNSREHGFPLVVFSGGADSTLTLHNAMKEHNYVDTLYIKIPIAGLKYTMERDRRLKIFDLLRTIADSQIGNDYFVDITKSFHIDKFTPRTEYVDAGYDWLNDKLGFVQPPMWLFHAFTICDPKRHSSVQMGYIKGDDASLIANEMKNLWAALWAVGRPDDKVVPLEFPLIRRSKDDVLHILRLIDKKLLDLVWCCENPESQSIDGSWHRGHLESDATPEKIRACGRCKPCITQARAKFDPIVHEASEKHNSSLDLILSKDSSKNNNGYVRYA